MNEESMSISNLIDLLNKYYEQYNYIKSKQINEIDTYMGRKSEPKNYKLNSLFDNFLKLQSDGLAIDFNFKSSSISKERDTVVITFKSIWRNENCDVTFERLANSNVIGVASEIPNYLYNDVKLFLKSCKSVLNYIMNLERFYYDENHPFIEESFNWKSFKIIITNKEGLVSGRVEDSNGEVANSIRDFVLKNALVDTNQLPESLKKPYVRISCSIYEIVLENLQEALTNALCEAKNECITRDYNKPKFGLL